MGNFLKHLHPLMRRKRKSKDYQDVNYAIINALQEQFTEMESDSVKSKIQSSLETATGEYLDIWGDWFGLPRKEKEHDTEYRNRIIEYFLLKRGTNNAIIKAVKDYFNDSETDITIYEPFQNIFFTNRSKLNGNDHLMGHYYRFAVIDVTIGRPFPPEIIDIINKFKPAGVQLFLTFDGASLITGSGVIPMPSQETKFDNHINLDIWNGYGDMFYGHLNLRNSNDLFSSDFIYDSNVVDKVIFKLNNSKLNSNAVLSGDPTMNRTFYNTAFITSKEFKPTHNSTTVSIKSKIKGLKELPFDFYNNTESKDTTYSTINLPKSNTDTYNMYLSFNVLKYFDINLKKVLKSFKGDIKLLKEYISNPKLNYEFKPVIPPNISFNVKYQFFNFKLNKWELITQDDIDYIGTSKSLPLGSLQDYISDIGNLFVRLQFDLNDLDSLDINFNYLDISFEHYAPNVYTVTPYLGELLNNTIFSYIDYLTCYKTPSIENKDIISKPGLQPIQYLRVTDNYDNQVNKNLIYDSNDYTRLVTYSGTSYNVSLLDSGASRITTSGGSSLLKVYRVFNEIASYTKEELTISFKIKVNKPVRLLFNGIRTESSTYLITPNDTSKLTQYVFKDLGVIGSSPQIQFRSPSAGEDLDFEIKDLKVEFGSVATKYQPNPRDIYGENDINQSTNISARSSVDNKIVDSNELSLYNSFKGKNLLRNTSETIKNNNYRIADYPLTEDLKDGDIVTITVKGQLGADKSALLFYNSGGYVRALNTNDKNYKYQMEKSGFDSNNIQTITGVWQTKSNTRESSNTSLYLYAYPNSGTSESQIEWIKLERGTESTPYQRAPEDSPGFLNKTIRFYGTRIDLDTITVDTTNNIPYAKIQYSQDNKNWYTIKTINNLNTSISVLNDTVDLYGLNLVNYRNITPFSNVTLNSIYRVKLKDLTSQGTVTDIPFGFFNARDTIVNYFGTIQANNMKIVKDTVNGMLDKSSGGIVRVSPPTISGFEKINVSNDILESETNVKINLGLPYSIDKLSDTKLSETEYLETRIPKIL